MEVLRSFLVKKTMVGVLTMDVFKSFIYFKIALQTVLGEP